MARQEQNLRQKNRVDEQQRKMRRNQIIFSILSLIIILSMLISLVATW